MAEDKLYKITTADMIQALFGVKTTERVNPLIAQAGIVALRVLAGNPGRLTFTLFNLSANAMYLGLQANVAADNGMYLAPNGGNITMRYDIDFNLVTREFYILAAGAASDLYVIENYII